MESSPPPLSGTEAQSFAAPVSHSGTRLANRRRYLIAGGSFLVLSICFARALFSLVVYAAGSQLNSYIILIPFISGYLIYLQRRQLPEVTTGSPVLGALTASAGLAALAAALFFGPWSITDYFTLTALSYVCLLLAGIFFSLGAHWVAAVAFPLGFLFFFIPMPEAMADTLEIASQSASAEAAALFFGLFGVPFLRDGMVFQLPDITIRVAQECSGIRSSWILLITSLLASYLFLRSPWRRAALVAFVIPLGIIRNGFRILVIGWLCTHIGPRMINSVIHHRGGPLFFALSLLPLFLLLWGLRRGEDSKLRPA